MRVLAGEDYIKYIEDILNQTQEQVKEFGNYELFLFDDLGEMHEQIKIKDKKYGLSRIISGYAFEWKSKNNPKEYDVVIGEKKLRWNSIAKDWINSENAINEVGCIHTTQGYDINYAGIILGNEIVYRNNKIEVIKENYYDKYINTFNSTYKVLEKEIINKEITITK